MKYIQFYFGLFILFIFSSCIEVEETFYINPDGSMKVEVKMTQPQMMFGNKSKGASDDKLKKFTLKTIKETANSYEALSNVKYALNDDELKVVSYTAYYKSYNDYQNDKSNMILPEMTILSPGVLSFKNNVDPSKSLSMSKKMSKHKTEPKELSEAELSEEIKKSKKESQMAKQMLPMVLGNMYIKKTFIFNGKITSSSNVQTSGPSTVSIEFDGKKAIGTMMEIFEDEAFIEASVKVKYGMKTQVHPADMMRKKMFGNTKPISFEIKTKGSKLFDYEKEKKKALAGMSELLKNLGEEYYENKKYEIIEDGKVIEEGSYKFGLKDGEWKEFHDNGKTMSESTYKQNKKHGIFKEWSDDGVLIYEGSYTDGKKHGNHKEWYDDGTPKEEGEYIDGKAFGKKVEWYKNGKLKFEGYTKKGGSASGLQKHWYKNGQIKKEYSRKNGMYDGIFREWYDNGQLMEEKKYVDGSLEDTLKTWDREGYMAELTVYTNDEIQGISKKWWKGGIKQEETTYVNDEKNGLSKVWSSDGKDSTHVVYKDDQVWEGTHVYFRNEKRQSEATYKNGKLDGVSKKYHWRSDKVRQERFYDDGKLIKTKEYDKYGKLVKEE